tara:strand:+ start:2079 stop:2390 length:312 start_codon:yes stop_codon:yes gene_type:complete
MSCIVRASLLGLVIVACFSAVYMTLLYDSNHWHGLNENNDSSWFKKLENRVYVSLTTASTVGYGDVSPKTTWCRMIVAVQMFITLVCAISFITTELKLCRRSD